MRRRTPVTTTLIVLNIAAFLYELHVVGVDLLAGGGSLGALVSAGALVPELVGQGEYWRLVTGAFLHGSALHIGVNMYSLYSIGRFVEVVAGPRRMAAIYGISLVGSSLAVAMFGAPADVTVGASGAIFGVFGALFAIGLKLGEEPRLERSNPTAIAAVCSRSFRDALDRIARFKRLTCPEEIRVRRARGEASVEFVYPEASHRHAERAVKVPRQRGRGPYDLGGAKLVAKQMGPSAAIYSVSKGRFVGYIHPNGRYVPIGRS